MSLEKSLAELDSPRKVKRVYGRRQSRPLNNERKAAFEALMPALSIAPELLSEKHDLNPATLFPMEKPEIWMEIGFGNGEFLSAQLKNNPDVNFIGVEPFVNGMAAFLKDIRPQNHENIRILMDDAILLASSLSPQSLERIYVLNPDPWPKARHHKRRIINQASLSLFSKILKPQGQLIMATDVDDLIEWMVSQASAHPNFTWSAQSKTDWETPPEDWPLITRYAKKGMKAGRTQRYLVFERCP